MTPPMLVAAEQCAEIEDLLRILGVDARVYQVVNPGAIERLITSLRTALGPHALHKRRCDARREANLVSSTSEDSSG